MLEDSEIRLLELFSERYGQPALIDPGGGESLELASHEGFDGELFTGLVVPVDGYTLADLEFSEVYPDSIDRSWDIHIFTVYKDAVIAHLDIENDEDFGVEDLREYAEEEYLEKS